MHASYPAVARLLFLIAGGALGTGIHAGCDRGKQLDPAEPRDQAASAAQAVKSAENIVKSSCQLLSRAEACTYA